MLVNAILTYLAIGAVIWALTGRGPLTGILTWPLLAVRTGKLVIDFVRDRP